MWHNIIKNEKKIKDKHLIEVLDYFQNRRDGIFESNEKLQKKVAYLSFLNKNDCGYLVENTTFSDGNVVSHIMYANCEEVKHLRLNGAYHQKGKVFIKEIYGDEYIKKEYFTFDVKNECLVKISNDEAERIWEEEQFSNPSVMVAELQALKKENADLRESLDKCETAIAELAKAELNRGARELCNGLSDFLGELCKDDEKETETEETQKTAPKKAKTAKSKNDKESDKNV